MTRPEPPVDGEKPPTPAPRQRIAKLMARAGLCSRRDAETWIVDGRVSVNGTLLTSPALDVAPDDAILVDGAPLPQLERTRLFLFHKPRGLVTSDRDPEGRATVADYLREHWPEGPRVVTVGRLDINTEGLLLLTNDGGLARVLELPKTGWLRRYRVRAKGEANPAQLDELAHGLTIDGVDYAGIEAKLDRVQGANSWLTMGLREGKNREIKRVLEHLGLEVNRLIRLSFGPFQLQDLPEGAVEEVRPRVLRDQLGDKLAAEAGVDFGDVLPAPAPRETSRGESPHVRPKDGARRPPERPSRSPRANRDDSRRDDRRTPRNDDRNAPAPIRERPAGGVRKHVSTLRKAEAEATRRGPRRRIERTDTQDRRDRTVKVERLVSTRPLPERPAPRPRRGDPPDGRSRPQAEAPRGARPARDDRQARGPARSGTTRPVGGERRRDEVRPPRRDDRPGGRGSEARGDAATAQRRHASPSALGKRERMARSGGTPERRRDEDPGERRERDGRKARTPGGAESRRGPSTPRSRDGTRSSARSVDDRDARRPREQDDRRAGVTRGTRGAKPDRSRSGPRSDAPSGSRDGKPRDGKPRTGASAGRPMGAASRKPGGKPSTGAPHRGKPRPPKR